MKISDAATMAAAAFLIYALAWTARVSASGGPPSTCCLRVSETRLRLDRIRDYTVQNAGICPVDAIVFRTKRGKRVCSDPERDWVKRAMKTVDTKKEESKRKKEETTTTGQTIAQSQKKQGGKKEGKGKGKGGGKARRGGKQQRASPK
ncbi:eotaxin-like [Megalops cyprinoides]|uniref:eotaxin-like n=1 Tax=Megalops cyprinoides TaxID=118141 RepID=UPI001864CECD|nr:eotaxin-like [Megalops cyprinoides]